MAEGRRLNLYTIPTHRAFADALVAGLIRQARGDPMALARGLVLLPNNRAQRAVTDAFVRASGGALLLPRLVPIGDPDLGEAIGAALDPAGEAPPPGAIEPLRRRMMLARLVEAARRDVGEPVDATEAVRLAGDLARTLDQLLVEEVEPRALRDLALAPELTEHWQRALAAFTVVIDRWPEALAAAGCIDAARRRILLLDRLGERWRTAPPDHFVWAAGISDTAPAVARLLRGVAELPQGRVVFAGLDLAMPDEEWAALGPHRPDPATGRARRNIEVHAQFHLKLLLERIGAGRGEVRRWRETGGANAGSERARAVASALTPARFTGKWTALAASERRLTGVAAAEFATPADEAQGIALALRGALETPGRTAALVTPDRSLARRVAAHCGRWGIEIDDTAGRPLAILPPGTLMLALADAVAERFAPLALLTLLKHPLVAAGPGRRDWLDGVRALDRALRGPRPATGLAAIGSHVEDGRPAAWWSGVAPRLAPLAMLADGGPLPLAAGLEVLRALAEDLCGDALWSGPAGRALAETLADLAAAADDGPGLVAPDELAPLLQQLLGEVAVRPPQGGHPRLAIYGLIEARLQSADLMILGGLNEGVWPGAPAPDPWLAPRIRAELGLPGLERGIGMAAHDFGMALGAPEVLVTRSRRNASAPAIASRFWLRLQAMAGAGFARDPALEGWARALDDPCEHMPAGRPAPMPPAPLRPKALSVTEIDRLKADPYAFYARRILGLRPLDPVDADPSAAWRGTAVHDVLEAWWREDRCAPEALVVRASAMLDDAEVHPMLRALWQPRLMEGLAWIAQEVVRLGDSGRHVAHAEGKGAIEIEGVTLSGRYDRIDRMPGGIAVVDYKTGMPPSAAAVRDGYSLQLGLLGLIAERGGFAGVSGRAAAFEYWSLARGKDGFGYRKSPCDDDGKRDLIPTNAFTGIAERNLVGVIREWLTGEAPFTAKLVPEYAPYAEYDQLMRRDEWYGRER